MYQKIPLKPHPTGWFVVSASHDLKKGDIVTRKFNDKEIIIFRTESGQVCVTDAHCPHMGAHFAFGGKIVGENIQCPFHHFCFDTQGNCTATGYGSKPSPKMKLDVWHYREKNGFILCWFDEQGKAPTWEVPDVDDNGFSNILTTNWDLKSHPQETTENSVDLGHFSIVHGYSDVEILKPLYTQGPYLTSQYTMTRKSGFMGFTKMLRTDFEVHVWGLGYSFVEVYMPELDMYSRQYVFPSVTADGHINLTLGMSIKIESTAKLFPLLGIMPKKLLTKLVLPKALKDYCNDVSQDFNVWQNKIYIDPPALAKGDGPVAQYRTWCAQFYAQQTENINMESDMPNPSKLSVA